MLFVTKVYTLSKSSLKRERPGGNFLGGGGLVKEKGGREGTLRIFG